MEIRVWDESGDLIGTSSVTYLPEEDVWQVEAREEGSPDEIPTCTWGTKSAAEIWARRHAEEFKSKAEREFFAKHGVWPKGVMHETGFSIQIVED